MGEAYHDNATYESPYLDSAVAVFALLAHPTRVKIILALRGMEMSASRLADIVDLPAEQVGNELAALESAGASWPENVMAVVTSTSSPMGTRAHWRQMPSSMPSTRPTHKQALRPDRCRTTREEPCPALLD